MSYLEALIFGLVQGISEFLPISSTAHIIITGLLLGYNFPGLALEIFLHIASVLAVILYFRKELWNTIKGFFLYFREKTPENRMHFMFSIYIIIATLITGGIGFIFVDTVEGVMKTPAFIAFALILTGSGLIFIERFRKYGNRRQEDMKYKDALAVGIGQSIAVLPGISRSGITLIASLLIGLERETAVRYSFLLAIPVILGSTVLAFGDLGRGVWDTIGLGPLAISFLASFIFSIVGIIWLIDFLKKGRLLYFAIYCYTLAILVYLLIDEVPPTI